jgi:hypothetical protein
LKRALAEVVRSEIESRVRLPRETHPPPPRPPLPDRAPLPDRTRVRRKSTPTETVQLLGGVGKVIQGIIRKGISEIPNFMTDPRQFDPMVAELQVQPRRDTVLSSSYTVIESILPR